MIMNHVVFEMRLIADGDGINTSGLVEIHNDFEGIVVLRELVGRIEDLIDGAQDLPEDLLNRAHSALDELSNVTNELQLRRGFTASRHDHDDVGEDYY